MRTGGYSSTAALTMLIGVVCGFNAPAPHAAAAGTGQARSDPYPLRAEVRERFRLEPGATIRVVGIEGSVEVETADGDEVDLHFKRYAPTQADSDCESLSFDHTPSRLVVEHHTDARCQVIQAYERMKLVVPRSANLTFERIEGDLTIGETNGALRLALIEGFVRVDGVSVAEMTTIERGVSIRVGRLGDDGISIRSVEADVELLLDPSLDADLTIRDSGGRRSTQIGRGGATITVEDVEGHVKIRKP